MKISNKKLILDIYNMAIWHKVNSCGWTIKQKMSWQNPSPYSFSIIFLEFLRTLEFSEYPWLVRLRICDALRDLVPFAQFKKREKHP